MKKSKQLKLKPSSRDNRRYLLIKNSSHKEVEEAILEYIGILGGAKAAYMKVKSNSKSKIIGSCKREELVNVKAALTLKGITVEKVANTLKGLSKE